MTNHTGIDEYEAPTLTVAGSLQDLTRNGALFPSDDGINLNTAQPVPPLS